MLAIRVETPQDLQIALTCNGTKVSVKWIGGVKVVEFILRGLPAGIDRTARCTTSKMMFLIGTQRLALGSSTNRTGT